MTRRHRLTRTTLKLLLLLIFLAALFFNPAFAPAIGNAKNTLPDFADFVSQVQNGEANVLRGVYVPDVLALLITQQPVGKPNYVSGKNGEVTEFSTASLYGNIGLLAHNTLSGKSFSQLTAGQEVRLIFGDGKVEHFVVTEVLRFQALQPQSSWSEFRELNSDKILSVEQLFDHVYGGNRHVTFQTCIQANGDWNWGRLFVLAVPIP